MTLDDYLEAKRREILMEFGFLIAENPENRGMLVLMHKAEDDDLLAKKSGASG